MANLVIKAGWRLAEVRKPAEFRLEARRGVAALFDDYADAVEAAHGYGQQLRELFAPGSMQVDLEERESFSFREQGKIRWMVRYRVISELDRERSYHFAYLAAVDESGAGGIPLGQYVGEADVAIREASAMLSHGLGASCPGLSAALAQARGAVLGVLEQVNDEGDLGVAASAPLQLACGSVADAVKVAGDAETPPPPALVAALGRAEAAMETVRGQYGQAAGEDQPAPSFQLFKFRQKKQAKENPEAEGEGG